ncbi:serine/threonine-protein kinase [Prosthecobacter sp.]|uniref:serine/threonine-protein kinase n=1 Tax=Prosthecobacter sp. TaxID=1965333 RepID=UPI0037845EB4
MNDRYELLAPIAEGGLGTVFRALDRQTGREVAIKRIRHTSSENSASALASLLHEARRQSVLHHPHVVAIIEAGTDSHGAFIAMELIHGETLEARLTRSALSLAEFDALVLQTLAAIQAAHSAGIIHLDLKPENLMLADHPDGGIHVKILDFGLARDLEPTAPLPAASPAQGSIFFMAPEQFQRAAVDVRTDLYSLGCLFYYAWSHQHPFEGETKPQVMVAHLYHRTTPLAQLRPGLPDPTVRWIEWLTSRSPSDRPATVAEALQAYAAGG